MKKFISLFVLLLTVTSLFAPAVESAPAVVREGHLAYADMNDEEYFKFLSKASDGDNNPDNNGAATGSFMSGMIMELTGPNMLHI